MTWMEKAHTERYLGGALVFGVGVNELFHAVFDGMDGVHFF